MKKQTGFTLIELMVSMVLGLIVLGATIKIYVATVGGSSSLMKSARLNHDLESVMTLMLNDIKRAGYWGLATPAADSRDNPFTTATTNLSISASTCVLYSYDADGDGIVDSDEYYGFKLDGITIKMRKTGATTANCNDGTWEDFIDSNQLKITALQFSFVPIDIASTTLSPDLPATSRCLNVTTNTVTDAAACAGAVADDNLVEKRVVNIQLTGQVSSDTTVTKTLNSTVEVRNSRLCLWNGASCT
jgi:type IV pilus assembly protein PilW